MPILSPRVAPLRKKLEDPEAIGTILLLILVDRWGTEFFNWEPQTLDLQAKDDFGADIPQVNKDKIWALVTYLTTDRFWSNLDLFVHICNSLSSTGADFQNYDPADIQEIAWAMAELMLLEPPEEHETLSPDITTYINIALKEEGFNKPPRILEQYSEEPTSEESVNEVLAMDEIDFKSFWDRQALKRVEVDETVRNRLYELLQDVAGLPFQNADDDARKALLERAGKALAVQSKLTAQGQEAAPATPNL